MVQFHPKRLWPNEEAMKAKNITIVRGLVIITNPPTTQQRQQYETQSNIPTTRLPTPTTAPCIIQPPTVTPTVQYTSIPENATRVHAERASTQEPQVPTFTQAENAGLPII